MTYLKKGIAAASLFALLTGTVCADETTFLGPSLRGTYNQALTNSTAYSLLGEAGAKHFRAGATIGWRIADNQLLKVSGEYLWDDITYSFITGNTDQWVEQGAIGAAYQYDFREYLLDPRANLGVYFSHAPNKNLSNANGSAVISGSTFTFVETRRIAGSDAAGVSTGLTVSPWWGNNTGLDVNYDNVNYNTVYDTNENAKGFGGTIWFNQLVNKDISVGASAGIRQPFNYYTANINYSHLRYYGDWSIGLYGDYTAGKYELPNTYDAGVSVNYYADAPLVPEAANLKGEINLKGEAAAPVNDNLLAWTSDPAVYMPQVLAITDHPSACKDVIRLIRPFNPAVNVFISGAPVTFIIPGGAHFSSVPGETFSLITSQTLPATNTISINPSTGQIIAHFTGFDVGTMTVTVVATSACGSVYSNTFVFTLGGPPGGLKLEKIKTV